MKGGYTKPRSVVVHIRKSLNIIFQLKNIDDGTMSQRVSYPNCEA